MKETKTGDVAGRPNGRSLFLGDPGAIFFCVKLETDTKKEKRSKKERKRRPVETDAADGNPQRTRIPTAAWKAQNAFHSFHKARRRFYRRDLIYQQGGAKSNDRKGPNQVDGTKEMRKPIDVAEGQYKALFALQFATGMRFGEMAGLHVEDLDFKELVVYMRRSTFMHQEVTPKSKAGHREVDVDSDR